MDPANDYTLYAGAMHLGAGLACGITGLAAGYAIGIVGDSVRFLLTTRHCVSCGARLNMMAVRTRLRDREQGVREHGAYSHLR